MLAFKRWIALAPLAFLLVAGLPGCKTGAKIFCWRQTSCSSASKVSCGESEILCNDSSQSACVELGKPVCTSTQGCLSEKRAAIGCKPACATPTSCASLGCVTMGQPVSENVSVAITPKPLTSVPEPVHDSPIGEANPFEEPPIAPEARAEEFPLPIPAPPVDAEARHSAQNPFLQVSRTEEWEERKAVPAPRPFGQDDAGSKGPGPVGHHLSKPWSDALGLPAKAPEPIQHYRRN